MIETLQIKNFKALRDVSISLTPLHVLIGPNDSGKTSVLEALMALCRSVDFEAQNIFAGAWDGAQLVWQQDSSQMVELCAGFSIDNESWKYRLGFTFPTNGRQPKIILESLTNPGDNTETKLQGHPVYSGIFGHMQQRVEISDAAGRIRKVHESLSGVQIYRWDPRFLALPVAPDSNRRFRMEPNGFGLALCLDDILGYDRSLFSILENKFKEIFPQIESIKLIPQAAYRTSHDVAREVPMLSNAEGKGLFFQFAGSKGLVPASQMSDGTLLVLAYLTILNLPEPPRVLLVEEPENGIHPHRLQRVLQILRDLIEKHGHTQILMTTHSPYVLDSFKPEEVTLCRRESDGSTSVSRLSSSEDVRKQLAVFSLGEIWTGQGDDAIAQSAREGGKAAP